MGSMPSQRITILPDARSARRTDLRVLNPTLISLLSGAALGLSVAIPFGPISLLCVQRSITAGIRLGIVTGLGAASVNVVYMTLAMTGAGAVSAELIAWSSQLRYLSCGVIVALGLRLLGSKPSATNVQRTIQARAAFASSFALALFNPLTIVPYLVFASTLAAAEAADAGSVLWSAVGVFTGVGGWYCGVSTAAALFRSGLPPGRVRSLNHAAGIMLIGFGLVRALR